MPANRNPRRKRHTTDIRVETGDYAIGATFPLVTHEHGQVDATITEITPGDDGTTTLTITYLA